MFSATIDVHGLNLRDALEMIGRKINRALATDADRIKIVHEKDSKKFSKALRTYLSGLKPVRSFNEDPENPSVTWVYLKDTGPEAPPPAGVDSPFLRGLLKK
jgi:hypothetical protein